VDDFPHFLPHDLVGLHTLLLNKKGLDPVMVPLLEDGIGNRRGPIRHGEAYAETKGEGFQQRLGN
jgi:hypothetical protein